MDEDITILITEAVTNVPEGREYPGSEVRWCSVCATEVWLSPSALVKLDKDPKTKVMCAACGVPYAESQNASKLLPVENGVPAQELKFLAGWLRKTYGKAASRDER